MTANLQQQKFQKRSVLIWFRQPVDSPCGLDTFQRTERLVVLTLHEDQDELNVVKRHPEETSNRLGGAHAA
jgi:hypothetical protein